MAARITLYIQFLAWILLALAGCGGNDSIPVASVLSSGRVTLSWDEVPGAASYELYIATTPGITTLNSYKISNVTPPITLTDLEPGTTYFFMVSVFSDTGESRTSKEVAFTVTETEGAIEFGDILASPEPVEQAQPAAAAPAPTADERTEAERKIQPQVAAAPDKKKTQSTSKIAAIPAAKRSAQNVQIEGPETQDVTVAWDDVPNASSYNIYWREKKGVTKQNGTKIANVTNPYKMKNLIKGKTYYFIVTAVNASGESPASEEFSFTVGGAN